MKILNFLDKTIEYSFYLLFLFVPLVFLGDTSELFEFNKMWLTFVLTIIIGTSWITKMVIKRELKIQRTPFDIPILIFVGALVISTLLSWDRHVSVWGYYSRFNGGLLSMLSYVFLYYAFLSNFADKGVKMAKRLIYITLASAVVVSLWGLPSHFGYDPTCLVFRGTLDVSCWTEDFQPKVRIFSTLGQPAWLAAYLASLIPVALSLLLLKLLDKGKTIILGFTIKKAIVAIFYILLFALFYVDLLYTRSRAAVASSWLSLVFYSIFVLFILDKGNIKNIKVDLKETLKSTKARFIGLVLIVTLVLTFFANQPFQQLNFFSFDSVKNLASKPQNDSKPKAEEVSTGAPIANQGALGGTDSGVIRKYVWQGAVEAWKSNILFGTGPETFAFAYYKFRPAEHNLTSEWKFLYNKAHNEYLNYLTTTGLVGFVSYLAIIVLFLLTSFKYLLKKGGENKILVLGIVTGYLTILATNFFGFSVVIMNLFFFFFPVLFLLLSNQINTDKTFVLGSAKDKEKLQPLDIIGAVLIFAVAIFMLVNLFRFWQADRAYALGYNLDRAGDYQSAYPYLTKAVADRPGEPLFKDELAINNAVIAAALLSQPQEGEQASQSAQLAQTLAQNAIKLTEEITNSYPKNIVFMKSKTRIYYTLGQVNPQYLTNALTAIKKAQELAPTDADISYNVGVLSGQTGDSKKAVEELERTIKLKPDYTNAYYALGIFYRQLATNETGAVIDEVSEKKAIEYMKQALKLSPEFSEAKAALDSWGVK